MKVLRFTLVLLNKSKGQSLKFDNADPESCDKKVYLPHVVD